MVRPARRTVFKGITKRTRGLLADWKKQPVKLRETAEEVRAADLVALANAASGGTILVGVRPAGGSRGGELEVLGCPLVQPEELPLWQVAASCQPQVSLQVYVENTRRSPLYRIEVPSGEAKPYCTPDGIYCIRRNGTDEPLTPEGLLAALISGSTARDPLPSAETPLPYLVLRAVASREDRTARRLSTLSTRLELFTELMHEAYRVSTSAQHSLEALGEKVDALTALLLMSEGDISRNLLRLNVKPPDMSRAKVVYWNKLERDLASGELLSRQKILDALARWYVGTSRQEMEDWLDRRLAEVVEGRDQEEPEPLSLSRQIAARQRSRPRRRAS